MFMRDSKQLGTHSTIINTYCNKALQEDLTCIVTASIYCTYVGWDRISYLTATHPHISLAAKQNDNDPKKVLSVKQKVIYQHYIAYIYISIYYIALSLYIIKSTVHRCVMTSYTFHTLLYNFFKHKTVEQHPDSFCFFEDRILIVSKMNLISSKVKCMLR